MTVDIVCTGPGPHDPPSGVLGTTTGTAPTFVRCGAEACRPTRDPAQVSAEAVAAFLADTHLPRMRQAKVDADAAKAAAQAVKNLPVTTVAEARTAIRDLATVVADLARLVNDLAAGEVKTSRRLLDLYDGTD